MVSGRRLLPLVVVLGALAATTGALAGTVSWGSAIDVPGIAGLNSGGQARLASISCVSPGTCTAVGTYTDNAGQQVYVVSEQGGVWGTAIEVPGSAALNTDGEAELGPVSCSAAGECAAGGEFDTYDDWTGYQGQAFLVEETSGAWATPIKVPGLAALDVGHSSGVSSISCASPGNCVASGYFAGGIVDHYGDPGDFGGFLVSEHDGVWGTPRAVSNGSVASVSCVGVGYCLAGGSKGGQGPGSSPPRGHAVLLTERNGQWSVRSKVPGLAALSAGGSSRVTSVSCTSRGNCAVGGVYTYGSHGVRFHPFVVGETNGKWGKAVAVRGAPKWAQWSRVSVACGGAGSCIAGGDFYYIGKGQAFVMAEKNGRWSKAIKVPGLAVLGGGPYSGVSSISCASAGDCAAVGSYIDHGNKDHAFVVAERGGAWRKTVEVPGTAALGAGGSLGVSISCASGGSCAVGGVYIDGSGHFQPFVTAP
jgi:hypothetical protein